MSDKSRGLLTRRDIVRLVAAAAAACVLCVAGWLLLHEIFLVVAFPLLLVSLVAIQTGSYRRLMRASERDYAQVEALISLSAALPLRRPLPPMRGWAISPDFAALLASEVFTRRPRLIVETGSGISTLIAAYCLEQLGDGGHIVSLDHDERFAARTRAVLTLHGLDAYADVLYAPLVNTPLGAEAWRWYDTAGLCGIEGIDLLVVDGPPSTTQRLARYPVLPVLAGRLSDDCALLVDDAARPDERAIVARWLGEYPLFTLETLPAEKGAALLYRSDASRPTAPSPLSVASGNDILNGEVSS